MSVTLIGPDGQQVEVEEGQVQGLVDREYRVLGSDERAQIAGQDARKEYYTSPGQKVRAAAAAGARGLTFGGSDVLARAYGAEDDLSALREYNEAESLGGELVSGLATGSIFAGAGAKAAQGAGALAKIGAAAKGAAIEGAAFGAGSGVSELALSADPITLERAVSTIGSSALFGAGVGGAAGALTKGVGLGLQRAKTALDDVAVRAGAGGIADDLTKLDAKGLRAAETAEREALGQAQVAQRSSAADEIAAYRTAVDGANPYSAITEGEPAALLSNSGRSLRNLMNDPIGLAENPGNALKALRVQEQAFTRALAQADDISAKLVKTNQKIAKELGEELATLPNKVDEVVLSGKAARRYASFADVNLKKGGSLKVGRDEAQRFLGALDNGEVAAAGSNALKKLPELLEANRGLQSTIKSSITPKAELASERLTQIANAKDALTSGRKGSFAEDMLQGSVFGHVAGFVSGLPIIGPAIGAKVAKLVTDGVFGRLGNAQAAAAAKASKAIGAFLSVAPKVERAAPVLASKVLSSVRYAASSDADAKKPKKGEKPAAAPKLADSYKARANEIRSQTMYDETGRSVMRPDTRAQMAARLDPVRVADPVLADQMETIAARRLEFLAEKLPKRPDAFAQPIGPDIWQPSDMQMRTFARYAAAVEDPHAVVDRLADGSVSPEDRDAMRAVYPEMYADIQQQIFEQLPTLQKTLPYQRRIALSIFSGLPVDPAMHPSILAVLQQQFSAEQGTDGGTQAPVPVPQFGSVKAEEPTKAQERA